MRYICQRENFWRNRLWQPGDRLNIAKPRNVPRHFIPVLSPEQAIHEKELAILRSDLDKAHIKYDKTWGKKQLQEAMDSVVTTTNILTSRAPLP